jgi:hypothetical protein
VLASVTPSILAVFKASDPKKDRRMDSALSGKMSIRNVIGTRNKWQLIFWKRQRKTFMR